jgi:amidase
MPDGLNRLPARELARLLREKRAGAVEVIDAHLAAIGRANAGVNAIVTLAADQARAAARAVDAAVARGAALPPLAGVPVASTSRHRRHPHDVGLGAHADHVPTEDGETVVALRAGCVVVGKTNTPEFAAGGNTVNRVFGATRNPWDLRMSASGSTGGGAAALAAALVPLAEGSDFGGSLRTPASFCGVVGLRTSTGLVARYPMNMPWHAQNVAGRWRATVETATMPTA